MEGPESALGIMHQASCVQEDQEAWGRDCGEDVIRKWRDSRETHRQDLFNEDPLSNEFLRACGDGQSPSVSFTLCGVPELTFLE